MTTLSPNLFSQQITSPDSLIPPTAGIPPEPSVEQDEKREFGDVNATRNFIFNDVLNAAANMQPISNRTHTLKLRDVRYVDPEKYRLSDQKKAILEGRSQGRRLKGTWDLMDNASGDVLDSREQVLAHVPYLTSHGTFIDNGSDYALRNQQRLRPGVFTRVKDNGEIESHANILPGKGIAHRYFLDPEKGVFYAKIRNARIPLMPLLTAMGATPKQLQDAWGPELFATNSAKNEASALEKIKKRILKPEDLQGDTRQALIKRFAEMELDPEVTQSTLGKPHKGLTLDALLDTTRKLIAVSEGKAESDDRDSLLYQNFYGPEDLFSERVSKDYGGVLRNLLWKASGKGNLSSMPSSALNTHLRSAFLKSGLGQALEEINPAEILDKAYAISRMGEGGIPSSEAIPDEAREVQPSHFAFMDPLRTPESHKAGVDLFLANNTRKGRNGKLYTKLRDTQGNEVWKTPQDLRDTTVAFPGELQRGEKFVAAMRNGKEVWVPREQVNLELPRMEQGFSPLGNMIPLISMVKGQRVSMASRMLTQALPLKNAEAPLVQAAMPGTDGSRSYEDEYANRMGALRADKPGKVVDVTEDGVKVRYQDGTEDEIDLYNNYPFNRKTYLHQTPLVKPGDTFGKGDLLARSNYTDQNGSTALGSNFRVAYMPWQGKNFEDAIVISEGAAKKMTSEHAYQHELELDDKTKVGLKEFVGMYPSKYKKETLQKLDKNGVIRPGTEVEYGDPLVLAIRQKDSAQNKVHKKGQSGYGDASVVWNHHDPGVVTDVVSGKKGPVVVVKAASSMQIGDKLSGRYGDKGVVADIIPDAQMPHDKQGKPFEILLSPLGIQSRTNPAQKVELALGKLAEATGKIQKVEDWGDYDYSEWANQKLRQAGLSPTEDLVDPTADRKIKAVPTGNRFFMKLHHTAESKNQARGGGGYTAEGSPARGGAGGSKRLAMLDTNALLSHGAVETLRDASSVRGQRNEEYWLQFMQGNNPRPPKVPMVYQKFVNQLKAAGINVVKDGPQTNIMALTDKDIDTLAGTRNLENVSGVDWKGDLKPLKGGLFDKQLTGGHSGDRWAAIKLEEPMPNPVMEEPIRRMLDLTQKQFEATLAGEHELPGHGTGPQAIKKALESIDVDKALEMTRANIKSGNATERDKAIRKLGYLKSAKKLGINPGDWMLKRAPVLPPKFRPVSLMSNDMPLVSDANFLYKELYEANQNLARMKKQVSEDDLGAERLGVYKAFKGVTGLGDPITTKNQEKGVKGILKSVFGSSPKFGTVQRKLISTTVDNVGRSVISPNPDFDMDTVGIPEDKAFDVYGKFIARRLRRRGMPLTQAMRHIKDRSGLAREALQEEMQDRPVYINRAPVLHKYGIMAFRPKLVKGDTMQVSPLIVGGFNADFDGDAMNFHVATGDAANKELLERMLPSRSLLSPADFKKPMHVPSQDYVGGLYYATQKKSDRPKRIFRTLGDARKAYARGELNMNDEIEILENS